MRMWSSNQFSFDVPRPLNTVKPKGPMARLLTLGQIRDQQEIEGKRPQGGPAADSPVVVSGDHKPHQGGFAAQPIGPVV